MSRAIVIETTSRHGQAALALDGELVALATLPHGPKHAAALVAEVQRLLHDAGWPPRSIDCVAVSAGPGSFTGTRVGVTFAKTFAFATGAAVVPVSTAAVVASNVEAHDACVVFDARRGSVWAEQYRDGLACRQFGVVTPAELLRLLPRPVTLVGEGVAYHADALRGEGVSHHPADASWPRIEIVARLGSTGHPVDAAMLVPTYVRRPEAEEQRLGREARRSPG